MKPHPIVGRSLRILLGLLLVPIALGATQAFQDELERSGVGARPFMRGLTIYLFIHLVIYKAKWLFDASHAVLSRVAGFVFGGKVVAMGTGGGAGGEKEKGGKSKKGGKEGGQGGGTGGGSPLVALSPFLVPTYVMLLAIAVGVVGMWHDLGRWSPVLCGLVGALLAFHWLMTLETIQQRKETIASAGYVLTVVLTYVISLSITAVALPLVVRAFAFPAYLASAYDASRAVYAALTHQLFL